MPDAALNMTPRQIEFARREQQILAAALSLFEGPHWEQVTVEQIAKQADIGKGTIYKHFSCKEEIYARIAIDFNGKIMAEFNRLSQAAEDVTSILKSLINAAFDLFISNPAEAHVIFYCKRSDFRSRLNEALQIAFQELDGDFQNFMIDILERGIRDGTLPLKPVDNMMIALEATFDGAMTMLWNDDALIERVNSREEYISVISDFMLAGIRA